jgi:cobalt-zinc-cadmium efflux system membrane fusion protein
LAKVGDRVQVGQTLALLDNIEAGELAAEYDGAKADLERLKIQQANSARQMERSGRLVEIGAASQKEFELTEAEHNALLEAIKAQASLLAGLKSKLERFGLAESDLHESPITSIPSPLSGVVIRMEAAPGEVVDPSMELFSIADLSEVWVQAEVYEKDLARIQIGQSAFISVDTYPDQRFSGMVSYISDVLDPKTRTARVRCEVPNPDARLKLDMFVSVNLPTTFSQRAVAVPTEAIQQVDGARVVFVQTAETEFESRTIQAGREVDGKTEVISGLQEGEPIVVAGSFHLKAILAEGTFGEEE